MTRDVIMVALELEKAHQTAEMILRDFISKIVPGMTESSLVRRFLEHQKEWGYPRNWHSPKIRVGANTIYAYKTKSPIDPPVKDGDLVLIDVGIIVGEYESDLAITVPVGNPLREEIQLAHDSQDIWAQVKKTWKEETRSGKDLYLLAEELAYSRGWILEIKLLNEERTLGSFYEEILR